MLSLVLAVTGDEGSCRRAIANISAALDDLGRASNSTELLILTCTLDQSVEGLLSSLEGATVLAGPPFNPVVAWWNGMEVAKGDAVWLGSTDSTIVPNELAAMYRSVQNGEQVAIPASNRITHAVFRADAVLAIGGLLPYIKGRTDQTEVLAAAAHAARGVTVAPAAQAYASAGNEGLSQGLLGVKK